MSPIQTSGLSAKKARFGRAVSPAIMTSAVPSTGARAQVPGKGVSALIPTKPAAINATPAAEIQSFHLSSTEKLSAFRLKPRALQCAIHAPIMDPNDVGTGTHIHFSLVDGAGAPALPDLSGPYGLSEVGSRFIAGILHHMPAITAVTAPSVASYYRLRPNRWAPTTANLASLDRGAAVRLCSAPGSDGDTSARQFNAEFRVADAAASPYLALGMLVYAGLDGVRKKMALP